jgi:hypothetical protein
MKKQMIFNLKPPSKAEKIYLDQLAKRPSDTTFREVFSKAQNFLNKTKEEINRQGV